MRPLGFITRYKKQNECKSENVDQYLHSLFIIHILYKIRNYLLNRSYAEGFGHTSTPLHVILSTPLADNVISLGSLKQNTYLQAILVSIRRSKT